ncbi:MAG: TonB-dependent receptor [Cyclobacteriaceae bacterium]
MFFNVSRLLILLAVTLVFHSVSAQKVVVRDQETNRPVRDVFIYNTSEDLTTVQTNAAGEADLSGFGKSDLINFQHAAYTDQSLTYNEIKSRNFIVLLAERIIPIEEVTIAANKWEEDLSEVPNEILTLSPKNTSFTNPQTSADLLAGTGEIFVQKSQLGGGSPMLRGFAANSVLLVIDGVRMNNAIYRSGNLQNIINIDPNALSGAEVVFGPGSVIYGSDALGGVMNFHTIQPQFAGTERLYVAGKAFTRYSSASNEKTGHFNFELGGKKLSLFSSVTYTDFDDLRTGSNRTDEFPDFGKRPFYIRRLGGDDTLIENDNVNLQVDSGFSLLNLIQKIRYRPSENIDLDYGFYYSNTTDIPRYDRLIQTNTDGSLRYAEWYYGPQTWQMHRLGAKLYKSNGLYDQLKVTAAYQDYRESRNDRRVDNTSLRNQSEQVDILSFNIDADKTIGKGNLFYGTEWLVNKVASVASRTDIVTGETTPTSSRYPDGGSTYRALSAYMCYKHTISPTLIANAGIRYSHVHLEATTTDDNATFLSNNAINLDNGAVNGTLGLVWKKSATTKFSALLSSGFRAPNVDDVGKVFEIDGDELVVPNGNLKPEYSYNAELSFKKSISDKITLDLVAYHSWLTDFITRGVFTIKGSSTIDVDGETFNVLAQRNFSNARIYGFGVNLNYLIDNTWAFTGTFNLTDGRETETDAALRHTPPYFGRVGLKYLNRKLKLEAFAEYSGAKKFEDLAPSEQTKTDIYTEDGSLGWFTLNLRSSYQVNEVFSLTGGIENILDKHYRTYSSGISAPGRNFILSLTAQF